MEYSLVLVFISVVANSKVQGLYSSDLNNTSSLSSARSNKNSFSYHNELSDSTRYNYQSRNMFEDSFNHYRSDRRDPRFVSIETQNENVKVKIYFVVPFLTIPVKRSISGAMGTLQNVIGGIPMAKLNVGAVILTGIIVVGGAMIGGINRLVNGGNFLEVYGNAFPLLKNSNKRQKQDTYETSLLWHIMEQVDEALMKYDFDTTVCTQRALCWYVKESLTNIEERKSSSFDYLISDLSSSDWVQKLLSNTAWNTAISAGKQGYNCESTFSSCKLSPSNLENFTNKIMQYATRK